MGTKINGLLGISLASLIRGLRRGQHEFRTVSCDTTLLVDPFESTNLATLPVRPLEEVLGTDCVPVTLDVMAYEDGMLPWKEAATVLALITRANPAVVLEIGTYMGCTTRAIARNLPTAIIHTLDLPLDYQSGSDAAASDKDDFHLIGKRLPGRDFIGTPEAARIRQHFGDSATWDYAQANGATCFFIDGSHTYEYCKIDTEKCFALCGGKGVFLWHDCDDGHPGVVQFLAEWRRAGRDIVRIKDTHVAYWDGR